MCVVAIHQPQYLSYLGFFHKLICCDVFVVLDDVQFQRRGVQNRNKIKSSHGWQWLTVPVLHTQSRSEHLICAVEINRDVSWQRKHWNALKVNYSRAPFFGHYDEELKQKLHRDWSGLVELNLDLTRWVMDVLGISTPLVLSSTLETTMTGSDRLIEICKRVGATSYLSGQGGRNYMDLNTFDSAGIEVIWQEFRSPVYEQVFPEVGFVPDLSVIDALFCCGPNTVQLLR